MVHPRDAVPLALGTVVLMAFMGDQEFIMLRSIANRCELVRLSFTKAVSVAHGSFPLCCKQAAVSGTAVGAEPVRVQNKNGSSWSF